MCSYASDPGVLADPRQLERWWAQDGRTRMELRFVFDFRERGDLISGVLNLSYAPAGS